MTLTKGWINRQVLQLEKESKTWPDWMQREINSRAKEQRVAPAQVKVSVQKRTKASPKTGI